MKKKLVITGTVNGQTVTEWAKNYRSDIPEERETVLENFHKRLEKMGVAPQSVTPCEQVVDDNEPISELL